MPDKLYVDETKSIIRVESYGIVLENDIAESITKTRKLLDYNNIRKVIVDTTKQETMPGTIAIFNLFSTFPREVRCAVLFNASQTTEEDLKFMENVAVNRGINIRIFNSEENAMKWLED